MRINPEEHISHLLRGGNLKSRMWSLVYGSMKVVVCVTEWFTLYRSYFPDDGCWGQNI